MGVDQTMPKSKGYNCKARQARRGEGDHRRNGKNEPSTTGSAEYYCADGGDTNAPVLPAKRKPVEEESSKREVKRKKLSNREKKRLTKIVEIKEKKSRVNILINAHPRGVVR